MMISLIPLLIAHCSLLAIIGALHLEYTAYDKDTKATFWVTVTDYGDSLQMYSKNDKGLEFTAIMDRKSRLLRLEKFQDGKEKTAETWTGDGYQVRMWGTEKTATASKPAADRHTIAFFLARFPFAEGEERNYSLLVPELFSMVEVNVKCLGKETVSTPAGDFSAWKLQMKGRGITNLMLLGKRFYLWYDEEGDHLLVKYEDSDGRGFSLSKRWED